MLFDPDTKKLLNGNMTDDGQRYTYKWDAFGRLKEVRNRSNSALVAEYKYNGLGYRIGWHYDTDADGTVESNTDDPWYLFVYDEQWRILNTYRLLDWAYNASNPAASYAKERFVYHNAGLGGYGGSSYIDSVMLRDRDAATAWNAASDGTMEERVYYAQNWRHDVSALITSTGQMVEWVKYSSYGVPWSLPTADTDSDGDFDATDASAITGTYDVRKDVNLDGTVDIDDFLDAFDLNNGYVNQGWSKLGLTKWGNRKGYAGYEGDTALAGTKWHVRHRVLESELGRWMRRDPAGYVDSSGLFQYTQSHPVHQTDPTGLVGLIPGCPPTEPINIDGSPILGDGWGRDDNSDLHCALTCYRSYGTNTSGGNQCCYNSDSDTSDDPGNSGTINTDPDCMGTIDFQGTCRGETTSGACRLRRIKLASHFIVDVLPYGITPFWYTEMHCCLRTHSVPSGTPGGGISDADLSLFWNLCATLLRQPSTLFCKSIATQ